VFSSFKNLRAEEISPEMGYARNLKFGLVRKPRRVSQKYFFKSKKIFQIHKIFQIEKYFYKSKESFSNFENVHKEIIKGPHPLEM